MTHALEQQPRVGFLCHLTSPDPHSSLARFLNHRNTAPGTPVPFLLSRRLHLPASTADAGARLPSSPTLPVRREWKTHPFPDLPFARSSPELRPCPAARRLSRASAPSSFPRSPCISIIHTDSRATASRIFPTLRIARSRMTAMGNACSTLGTMTMICSPSSNPRGYLR